MRVRDDFLRVHRRQFLVGVGTTTTALLGGCGANASLPDLAIEATEPMLELGERATLRADVRGADRLSFSLPEGDTIRVEGVDVSPESDQSLDTFPPIWQWNPPVAHVEATMRVRVTADPEPGVYQYGVRASRGENTRERTFSITVVEGPG